MKRKRYGNFSFYLLLCLAAGMLSGCGAEEAERSLAETEQSPYAGVLSMEETPVVDYELPRLLPNILVDTKGYCIGDGKVAGLKGRELPEEFCLVDALTGEEVYRGTVRGLTYHDEMELYSADADFSDFDQSGIYYLECDRIGASVCFPVRDSLYAALFEETYAEMAEKCSQKSLTLPEAAAFLETYEWYPDIFPDQDGDGTADILRELRSWVAYVEENGTSRGEDALYAAFLAKFSYIYQKFDRKYATDCLKRASTIFGQTKAPAGRDADWFFALTELYRATGLYAYRMQIADYKDFFREGSSYLEEASYLHGVMTYMATRQKVDVELCESAMSGLMERAEEISRNSSALVHPVAAPDSGAADLLKGAVGLSCANYIMNNYQYTGLMEDFLHYLMGRNRESVCFYEARESAAGYLLLAAQMTALHGQPEH